MSASVGSKKGFHDTPWFHGPVHERLTQSFHMLQGDKVGQLGGGRGRVVVDGLQEMRHVQVLHGSKAQSLTCSASVLGTW